MARGNRKRPVFAQGRAVLLSKEESPFLHFLNETNVIVVEIDGRGYITFVNEFASRFFGYSPEELVGRNAVGTLVPDEKRHARLMSSMLRNIWRFPQRYACTEAENMAKSGERKWVLWSLKSLHGVDVGARVLCIGIDITDRKVEEDVLRDCCGTLEQRVKSHTAELVKMNEALQQEVSERKWVEGILRSSEEKYRLVVENAHEGIVINQDGYMKYINPVTSKLLNIAGEDLISRPINDFMHPDDRKMVENRRLMMMNGKDVPHVFKCRIIDRDGQVRWLEVYSIPIKWMGRPAALSFFNNITQRVRAEEEVRQYQSQLRALASELSLAEERERRRIATGLHDYIGQSLAMIKIKLGTLRESLPESCPTRDVDHIRSLVEQAIKHTKSLTFQLSPPILYELGFEATLEWLGEEVQREHGISVEVFNDGEEKPLDVDVSVLLFQAVRELFINTVKHGKAKRIRAFVGRDGDKVLVVVEDDGIGFDTTKLDAATFGFFSIRERLKHFNGTFHVAATPGRGTVVFLTAPISAKEAAKKGSR